MMTRGFSRRECRINQLTVSTYLLSDGRARFKTVTLSSLFSQLDGTLNIIYANVSFHIWNFPNERTWFNFLFPFDVRRRRHILEVFNLPNGTDQNYTWWNKWSKKDKKKINKTIKDGWVAPRLLKILGPIK